MKIQVTQDKSIEYDTALSTFVDAHVSNALERFAKRINTVDVQLSMVAGKTRGGDDKRCQLEVGWDHNDSIVANDDAATLESAVMRASERMCFLLTSKFGEAGERALPD
jgi:ribosome-associated translation inhibitor RaiA